MPRSAISSASGGGDEQPADGRSRRRRRHEQHLVGAETLAALPAHAHATLSGAGFFPNLISGPFRDGLDAAFIFAIAAASMMRGGRYHHAEEAAAEPAREIANLGEQHAS